jgi:hypothetical protein
LISSSLIGPCARLAALSKSSSGWWSVTSELLCRLLLQRGRARIQGVADAPHRVWAVDFQSDATTDGRPIKIVSIIDEHTRECLGGLVQRSITGENLIAELDCLAAGRGTYPAVLRCDNGPELACVAMADWANSRVGLHFIPPGQPGATATSNRSTPASATNASTSTASGHWPRPVWSSATGNTTTTTTADTQPSATNPQPATLPPVPTDERLSLARGPVHGVRSGTLRLESEGSGVNVLVKCG